MITFLISGPSEPPPNIQAHSTGPTSIMVLWKPIPADFINGILLGYLVICLQQEIGSDRTVQVVSTDNTSVEFSGLQKNTIYSVKVVGFTVAGNGTISEPVHVSTEVEGRSYFSNAQMYYKTANNQGAKLSLVIGIEMI